MSGFDKGQFIKDITEVCDKHGVVIFGTRCASDMLGEIWVAPKENPALTWNVNDWDLFNFVFQDMDSNSQPGT